MGSTILHAFNWTFDSITKELPAIKAAGYNAILTSPITFSEGKEWWKRYQPLDFRIIHSPLGGKKSFKKLTEKAKENQIEIYIDVVINHMAHRYPVDGKIDLNFPGEALIERYKSDPIFDENKILPEEISIESNVFSSHDFNQNGVITNYNSTDQVLYWDIGDHRAPFGLPDLKYHSYVVDQLKDFLRTMNVEFNVTGFRIDAAKHVPLGYINDILSDLPDDVHLFAEVLPQAGKTYLKDIVNNTRCGVYDFPLFYKIKQSFAYRKSFDGLINYDERKNPVVPKSKSITFVTTHDIPNNLSMIHDMFPNIEEEMLAYTYILGRDGGCPLIYSDPADPETKVNSFSNRWYNLHKHPDIVKMIRFHNHCSGSEMMEVYRTDDILVYVREGKGFFAINKSYKKEIIHLDFHTLNAVAYSDLFTENKLIIQEDEQTEFLMGPRSKHMYLPADQ
jgi:alpha-amylase